MGYVVEDLLETFSTSPFKGPIPYSLQYSYQQSPYHILTICACHGDEVGSLPSALKYFQAFTSGQTNFNGKWTLVWGNPQASQIRKRFVQKDLNRLYGHLDDSSLEGQRAFEVSKVIKEADLFVDFHQTIMPTFTSFCILRWNTHSYHLARALGKVHVLLFHPAISLDKNPQQQVKTQVDFASLHGIPCVTVELGVKGFNKSSQSLADHLFHRLLEIASLMDQPSKEARQNILAQKALENPKLSVFECIYKEPFASPEMGLNVGWKNFAPLQKGEVIGYRDKKTPLLAPQDGVMIFPKYPQRNKDGQAQQPLPENLYLLAQTTQIHQN